MANDRKSKQNRPDRGTYGQGDIEYCSLRLSAKDAEEFRQWMGHGAPEFETALDNVMAELYRVTFKADVNSTALMCTFTQQDNKHHNSGIALVSRSDDPIEAFYLNCYKVYQLFPKQRLPTERVDNTWG